LSGLSESLFDEASALAGFIHNQAVITRIKTLMILMCWLENLLELSFEETQK
jgi:hypothetical protein